MTDYREINAFAKDPARSRMMAQYLLTLADLEWTDWELDFLDHIAVRDEELTTRQAEKLVEIRDNSVLYSKVEGFVFKTLIRTCWLNRHELSSDHDIEFVERLKETGAEALRKLQAMRLLRCARAIGELEPHQGWTFIPPSMRHA